MEKAMKCEVGGQPVYRGDERMVSRFSRKNKILKLKSSLFFLIIKETITENLITLCNDLIFLKKSIPFTAARVKFKP